MGLHLRWYPSKGRFIPRWPELIENWRPNQITQNWSFWHFMCFTVRVLLLFTSATPVSEAACSSIIHKSAELEARGKQRCSLWSWIFKKCTSLSASAIRWKWAYTPLLTCNLSESDKCLLYEKYVYHLPLRNLLWPMPYRRGIFLSPLHDNVHFLICTF